MWTNGDDQNHDTGDRVRLYQPILYSSGRPFSQRDDTVSYIGGHNQKDADDTTRQCRHCHSPLTQLVQLHSQQRTYTIVGCNRAACVNALFAQGNTFSCGGGGVFFGQSIDATTTSTSTTTQPTPAIPAAVATHDWTMDSDDDDDDDDEDLEQQVAAMELNQNGNKTGNRNGKNTHSKKNNNKKPSTPTPARTEETSTTSLPCFELHSLLEPPAKIKPTSCDDDDDKDDYLVGSTSASDAKIQQMLARYMAEEEDVEILAALQGTTATTSTNTKDKKNQEKDERLNATDRALLAFTDRMQRSPRQVVRHAPHGIPLWSLPTPQAPNNHPPSRNKKNKKNQKQSQQQQQQPPIVIPPCPSCLTPRRFEFQIMPSLLHVLEVDKYALQQQHDDDDGNNKDTLDDIMSADYGGMNWGVIAVYTCPRCSSSTTSGNPREDFLVVQASVDEAPCKRVVAPVDTPVFIQEHQTFNALNNDGDVLDEGDDDDDDDEETVNEEYTMDW